MARFVIAHMYPDLMNLYGDRGNVICLKKRIQWYGHEAVIHPVMLGEPIDFDSLDMVFMGGGSDREQNLFYQDLITRADAFLQKIQSGLPVLCICGSYQLLGEAYITHDGQSIDGLGFFRFVTRGEQPRLIGNIVIEADLIGQKTSIVGFENHGGRTYLEDKTLQPFGRVVKGRGNNGRDGTEGMHYHNLIGTYLHGPILPKNPVLTDFFIQAMCDRKGIQIQRNLDDSIETFAHVQAIQRLK